jgi:plastocyanin
MQTTSRTSAPFSVSRRAARGLLLAAAAGLCGGAAAGEVRARITTAQLKPVADAVVVIAPRNPAPAPNGGARDSVDQVDLQFVPYVKAIRAGTEVHFPNNDNVRHQVYSFSPAKRFELPLYAGTPAEPVLFDQPGIVTLGCNIHDWMVGYVYVADTPWFATTGADGTAVIAGVPPGEYRASVWHPEMQGGEADTARDIAIAGEESQALDWQLVLKPGLRPRRAPVGRQQGYR